MAEISKDSICSTLLEICPAIMDLSDEEILSGPSDLEGPYHRLDVLASLEVEDDVEAEVESLLRDPGFRQGLEAVTRLRRVYSLRLEIERARSILDSPDPWETLKGFAFYPNYLTLARTEFEGADLKPGDRVVFLGSGPLPLSLIVLCREHGLEGIGIEREPPWAELSRKVIEKLGLSTRIEILTGDHFSFPLEKECKLVMVAAMAQPKDEIFDHLARVSPPGTKISYRIYEKGLRRLLDIDYSFSPPAKLQEHLRIRPEPPVNNTVVFLTRKAH